MDDVLQPPQLKLTPTPRTTLKRRAQRGSHERAAIDAILDEAFVAHVGVTVDGAPRVLPTAHVRLGDTVYLHGSRANRLLCAAIDAPCCITVTLLDGLVLSRTAFHHSMNYRSVVLYGEAREVIDEAEKRAALHALIEHIAPGRLLETRAPTEAEMKTTLMVALDIEEGSAKARTGPAIDDAEVMSDPCWAGVLPLKLCALPPVRDAQLALDQLASPSLIARARQLAPPAQAIHAPYERAIGDLVFSTDRARVDFAFVHKFLSEESYWAKGVSADMLHRALEHALCMGIYRGAEQLGFARIVTDYARIAYLGDVFIAPHVRGQGLSKQLVQTLLEHPDLAGMERWLLGTADAHELYARYGFVRAEAGRYMVRRLA